MMGRSLGSASVLELASTRRDFIDGLIIESGFAHAGPLLRLLGVNSDAIGFREESGFRNLDKIRAFDKPTLIIHAELDHIIPFHDGQDLYDASPAGEKMLLKIPGANHNDIFDRALPQVHVYDQGLHRQIEMNAGPVGDPIRCPNLSPTGGAGSEKSHATAQRRNEKAGEPITAAGHRAPRLQAFMAVQVHRCRTQRRFHGYPAHSPILILLSMVYKVWREIPR